MTTLFNSKLNGKKILCVALSLCVVLAIFLPIVRIIATADNVPDKMLHIETTENWKELYQKAPVEAGKTYNFAFSVSSNVTFTPICVSDGGRVTINADIKQREKEENTGYTDYVYSYEIPDKDAYGSAITPEIFIGIAFTSAEDGYFFNSSFYAADDTNKTELFANPDFSSGVLDNWAWGWDQWFGVWSANGMTEWSNSTTVLTVEIFDENAFNGEKVVKMMYIKTTSPQYLMHRAKVEMGETYHFVFSISDSFANHSVGCFNNWERDSVNTSPPELVEKVEGNGYSTYTYSITMPSYIDTDDDFVFFGIKSNTRGEAYLFNVSVYKVEDANKTQLLERPDFATGLQGWGWGWDVAWLEGNEATNNSGTSTFKIVEFDESLFEEKEPDVEIEGKMLYINTQLSWKELYQKIAVQVGKTYNFAFSVTNNVSFRPICVTDNSRNGAGAEIKQVSKTEKSGYTDYIYSYTIPEKDEAGNAMTAQVFIGIAITAPTEGYFFNASAYDSADASKNELFLNPNFSSGVLDEWAWGWDQWFGVWCATGMTEWSNDDTTLKVMDIDTTLFPKDPEDSGSNKMLHIQTTENWKELYQKAFVEPGKTYYFEFSATSNVFFKAICTSDDSRHGVNANIKCIEKKQNTGYVDYKYSYTIPETDENGNPITSQVFIGVAFTSAKDGYFFGASFYEAEDSEKLELFLNPDFSKGVLDEWAWGWEQWFGVWCAAGMTEWTNNTTTTLKVIDYDESLFEGILGAGDKMLYIKTEEPNSLMQRALVEPGKSYNFTFSLTKTIKNFKVTCFGDDVRYSVNAKMMLIDQVESEKYITYTYKYTIPEKDDAGFDISDKVFFGIQPLSACEGYMFNISVYEADDPNKSELFDNADFASGNLTHWAYGWDIMWLEGPEITSNSGKSTFKVMDYDETLLPVVDENTVKKMVNFINGATGSPLASRTNVEVGETYVMELKAFTTGNIGLYFTEDDDRPYINTSYETETSTEGNVTSYKITFTVPERTKDGKVFLGPSFSAFSEGYIYDMTLYRANDPMKINMWENANFEVGLDGWIWGWHEWFGVLCETGIYDWTNGLNTLHVMDLDVEKIDKLVAEINVNDGEWWEKDDILEETVFENAALNGTLVDQNGKPMSAVDLILVSENREYKTTTNAKGEFVFKNFYAEFYELYAVDASGNKFNTNFFSNFYGGDTVTLNLICDSSSIDPDTGIKVDAPVTENNNIKASMGSLDGTVYTPTLKTVANIKVYIRGFGETVTDENGTFEFKDIPVGEYELYTVLDDGSEYIFRKATIKENINLSVKLKYDVEKRTIGTPKKDFNWIWVAVTIGAILVLTVIVILIVISKKHKKK